MSVSFSYVLLFNVSIKLVKACFYVWFELEAGFAITDINILLFQKYYLSNAQSRHAFSKRSFEVFDVKLTYYFLYV